MKDYGGAEGEFDNFDQKFVQQRNLIIKSQQSMQPTKEYCEKNYAE